ncbi:unnamed protein product [Rhizophagus irregularis]|nr:unnamed protein product [Rhizophagus irregularis]
MESFQSKVSEKYNKKLFGLIHHVQYNNNPCIIYKQKYMFYHLNNVTVKEIVHELKIHRKVDYHDNIIRCYGITSTEYHNNNNYMLVMEYANSACAVSCLHKEGIIHRDLHSGEQYDVDLILEISQGLRETVVPGTPEEYVKIYTKCWDREPDNRPTIYQVVECLNAKTDELNGNY